MVDLHIHSEHSHDSHEKIDRSCQAAIEKGLLGIAVCDHVDMGPCDVPDTYEQIAACIKDVAAAKKQYDGELRVLQGIELAEYAYDKPLANRILALGEYDVILGSVHYVPYRNTPLAYSQIDFAAMSVQEIHDFLKLYFTKIADMFDQMQFDVLTHLTCPLRYINGKYGRGFDYTVFRPEITEILARVIERDMSLEVNTSGLDLGKEFLLPSGEILSWYRKMGGKRITLGSDAHVATRVGIGFDAATELLRELGFKTALYYEKRKPQEYSLAE